MFHVPMVFDFQGSVTEEMIDHRFLTRESRFYAPLRRLERWIDRAAPVVFTSSAHAERLLIEQFGCRAGQIRPLPDCVDADVFKPAREFDRAELAALRQRLGIPAGGKVIVYLGLLAEYQGTSLLLEATRRILQEHSDVYLLLMGFPAVEHYQEKARNLGIEGAVIFTGRVPYAEAPKHLALGDVAAAPKLSLTESAGKLLNYMAMGLPTVAFDTPVAREYLGIHGLLAQPGDVQSLADKLSLALFAPEIDQGLGQRLRQRAVQHYTWEKAGQHIVEAYQQVLQCKQTDTVKHQWAVTQK
jgi:glycosyltransferase involved in cell wall biosynthesis